MTWPKGTNGGCRGCGAGGLKLGEPESRWEKPVSLEGTTYYMTEGFVHSRFQMLLKSGIQQEREPGMASKDFKPD